MATPMDRYGREDPFRRMEKLKLARKMGVRCPEEDDGDIEAPITAEPDAIDATPPDE